MNIELTPVELIGQIYFKREDKFQPFKDSNVNGSKLRQCMMLIEKNKESISNGILTATSINSPQSAIVAQVAKYYKTKCTIFYGGTSFEKLNTIPYAVIAKNLGANIEIVSNSGRQSVLQSKVNKRITDTNEFVVKYGFDLENNIDCFITSVADQVANLPDDIQNLVVTCGSAITLIGILTGVAIHKKNIKNIYAIGVAPNRLEKVKKYISLISEKIGLSIFDDNLIYIDAFNTLKGFKYENIKHEKYEDIVFHQRYEAKTFNWLKNNLDYQNEKTCMWIVGGEIETT